jgi:hypothetical protein
MFNPNPNIEQLTAINRLTDEGKLTASQISKVVEVVEESVVRFMEERKKATSPKKSAKTKEGD